mgnify:CR=1 FL=1
MKNKLVRFTKFSKVFFGISLGIILIGIICNFVFGTQLDIQFRGGSYIKYSYVGDVDTDKLKDVIQTAQISFPTLRRVTLIQSVLNLPVLRLFQQMNKRS